MTTETIEQTRVVTEEELVTICNNCGREVDDEGAEFAFKSPHASVDTPKPSTIHLCSACIDDLDEDFSPSYVEPAEEWLETVRSWADNKSYTIYSDIKAAYTISKVTIFAALAFLGLQLFVIPTSTVLIVSTASFCLVTVLLYLHCWSAVKTAMEAKGDDPPLLWGVPL